LALFRGFSTAVTAKAIASSFYGRSPVHSYFVGCSKGGQEGYMGSQRYLEDFDGIISGSAADDWTQLFTSFVWTESVNLAGKESYLTLEELKKVDKVVTNACAKAGDAEYGFLSDPLQCKVKGEVLGLTPAKLRTYELIHQGPKDRAGRQVFAGQPYGSELHWSGIISGARFETAETDAQMSTGADFFRNFVYQDRRCSFKNLDLEKTLNDGLKMGKIMNAADFGAGLPWHHDSGSESRTSRCPARSICGAAPAHTPGEDLSF
jgi:hypothetical protein